MYEGFNAWSYAWICHSRMLPGREVESFVVLRSFQSRGHDDNLRCFVFRFDWRVQPTWALFLLQVPIPGFCGASDICRNAIWRSCNSLPGLLLVRLQILRLDITEFRGNQLRSSVPNLGRSRLVAPGFLAHLGKFQSFRPASPRSFRLHAIDNVIHRRKTSTKKRK